MLLVVGLVTAFMNGAVSNLTQDFYNNIITQHPNSKLSKIWDRYDETIHSLFLVESFFVLSAMFLSGLIGKINDFNAIHIILFSVILTFSVVLTNLILYYLGKRFSSKSILSLSPIIYYCTAFLIPLVRKFMLIFIKISGKKNDDITIEEITDLVEEAREDGSIADGEYRLLKNVMNFNDILVSDVMTPRTVLFSCKSTVSIADAIKMPELQMYSRFPIWDGDSIDDKIIGYVITKEVFSAALNGKMNKILKDLSRELHFIPENAELGKALDTFLAKKQHLFLVVDEYGGIEGLLTMEDVLETMLGVEIIDEADKVVDLRLLAKYRREARIRENYTEI